MTLREANKIISTTEIKQAYIMYLGNDNRGLAQSSHKVKGRDRKTPLN